MALTEEMIFWKLYDFEIEEKQCKGLNRAKKQTWMQFFFLKKLPETPGTKPIVAKLCMIDSKNRKIAEKLVQISKYLANLAIWLIWLFGCAQKTLSSGVSLKRALKCSSEALTSRP